MRHKMAGRRLSRTSGHRKALFKNLVTSLLRHEKIETTTQKAKELRIVAEKTITIAKRGKPNAHREVFKTIKDKEVMTKLFDDLVKRVASRNGGYTRIIHVGNRKGDCAAMSIIELVDRLDEKEKTKDKEKTKVKEKEKGKDKKAKTKKKEEKVAA